MQLRLVTKLDKRNKISKKIDDDVISENCDITAMFPIYSQFGAIQKPDTRGISLTVTFYYTKSENRTKKSLPQLSHYCFE